MVQNEQRFCLLNSIPQEPYIIWLPFMIDKCKMKISPGVFSFFQNFDFLVSEINGQKRTQNDKNFCLLHLISQESLFIMDIWKRKSLLIFFQFLIFGANSGVNCVLLQYFRKHIPYDCDFWYTDIKWWHLHMIFSFYQNGDFLSC